MPHPFRTRVALIAAGTCLALLGLAARAQSLVVNGDFSRGGDPPSGWVKEPEAAAKGSVAVRGGVLELSPNSRNTPSHKPLGIGQAIEGAALQGQTLAVSARLGLRGPATGAVVGVHALRADGSEIAKVHLRRSNPGDALETVSGVLQVPASETPRLLILFAVAEGLGGGASFADIAVVPQRAASPPTARSGSSPPVMPPGRTGSTAAPPPASAVSAFAARVSVDAGARGRTIPRALYGVNIEWWRNANGVWDERGERFDPKALELTKALGTSVIRFPGGYLGDMYEWRDGVGPRAGRRPIATNIKNREKEVPRFATDELVEFAGAVGADLMLQANLGTGTSKTAADWVAYMRQLRERNPRAARVDWWEMGNELYHKDDASGASMAPEAYADKVLAFAREMKAADPSIRIGAIGMENYPLFPFNSYRNWNEIVLKRTGGQIDFFAVHNGYAPVAPDDGANPRDVYRALWAAPLMVADNLRKVAEQIARNVPPERAAAIGIAVTEWAPLFHVTPSSAWIDHSKTLGSALYVADVLRVFVQDERTVAATFFKLNEASFLGLFGARRGEWIPNASYYAFQLFTRHFGTTLVGSRAEAPTYDSVRAGIVPAMQRVPTLESVASVSEDGRRLYVILINKSIDQAADVAIELRGFEPSEATAHLLTGASPDSNTGTQLPAVPGLRWAKQVNVDASARHFDRGAPGEVSLTATVLPKAGRTLTYRVPPHSAASLELRR